MKELKELDVAHLAERDAELRKQLFTLRTGNATEKVKDVSQFKKTRQDIARIKTIQTQREKTK